MNDKMFYILFFTESSVYRLPNRKVFPMQDENKTNEELTKELNYMRERLANCEVSENEIRQLRKTYDNSEKAFKSLFHKSLDVLIIVDDESGEILEVNETARSILGYTEKDLIGEHFSILFPPETELSVKENLEKVKVYGTVFVLDFRRSDGSQCVVDLTATMFPWYGDSAILVTIRDVTERVQAEREREKLIVELQEAMERITTLKGLLPICAHCKNILNEDGHWQQVEAYVTDHSKAQFSHGICPDCVEKHYPELHQE